jgi:hypothetical protein
VLFGEVWMCARQSNTEMPNSNVDALRRELPTANYPLLRLFHTPHTAVPIPQEFTFKRVPHTGMAVISDVGNLTDIHPQNKREVAHRLALWALAKNYGQPIVCSGPIYQDLKIDGDRIRVRFDSGGGTLASRDGKPLDWFTVAGDDLKFVSADAVIDGNCVVVHSGPTTAGKEAHAAKSEKADGGWLRNRTRRERY